jgi:TolB protein
MAGTPFAYASSRRTWARSALAALLLLAFLPAAPAEAGIAIDITKGNAEPISVALPYPASGSSGEVLIGQDIMEVAERDLVDSGFFTSPDRRAFLQTFHSDRDVPQFDSWKMLDVAVVVVSSIAVHSPDSMTVSYRVWDAFTQKQLTGKQFTTHPDNRRRIGHIVADTIYEALTGEAGYFDSRIAYVAESFNGRQKFKRLAVMDQDGANHAYLTADGNLVLTPRFSRDGKELLYMSYAGGGLPALYLTNLAAGGKGRRIGSPDGMSYSPNFSPDGREVVMAVSRSGNSDLYAMGVRDGTLRRVASHLAIDTSPSYSPDGSQIAFSSDRSGSPQIYVMDKGGANVARISYGEGQYNTPVWSPTGDYIAFTKQDDSFHIGVMKTDGSGERILTTSYLDEGPAWSPNGRLVVFARQSPPGRSAPGAWNLYVIDIAGNHLRRLPTPGQGSDPTWAYVK